MKQNIWREWSRQKIEVWFWVSHAKKGFFGIDKMDRLLKN